MGLDAVVVSYIFLQCVLVKTFCLAPESIFFTDYEPIKIFVSVKGGEIYTGLRRKNVCNFLLMDASGRYLDPLTM